MAHGILKKLKLAVLGLAALASAAHAGESIVLASTTSTEQSGLFNFILPIFEKDSGIAVKVVALGTGQALDVGRRGDADVLLVHDRAAEDKFVADGYGVGRRDVCRREDVLRPDRALGLDLDRVPGILRRPLEPFGRHERVGDAGRARCDGDDALGLRAGFRCGRGVVHHAGQHGSGVRQHFIERDFKRARIGVASRRVGREACPDDGIGGGRRACRCRPACR